MLAHRMLWKDWGFAPTLFGQARHFLELAKGDAVPSAGEAYVRASIVFALVSFEAYFFELLRAYIQQNKGAINPAALIKVEHGLQRKTGITAAIQKWPKLLTGRPLDETAKPYGDLLEFISYRNSLLHGKITEKIPLSGKLAQDIETVDSADLAQRTVSNMVRVIAKHFGFDTPNWAS